MKYSLRFYKIFLCLLTLSSAGLAAQGVPSEDFIESGEVRRQIVDTWLSGEMNKVSWMTKSVYTDRYVYTFIVDKKKDVASGLLAVSVVPDSNPEPRGTWILYRRLSDGLPDSIRIYPVNDRSIYVTLRPSSNNPERDRSLLDLTIQNVHVCTGVPVAMTFVRLYTATFSSIVAMTRSTVPWNLLVPDPDQYADIAATVSAIRDRLPSLVYLDDGAFDASGDPVLIQDGSPQDKKAIFAAISAGQDAAGISGGVNCAGFAKWIIDGMIKPVAGNGLEINPLKTETRSPDSRHTNPYKDDSDTFFALDWTRNLASAVVSLSARHTVRHENSGVDVTVNPYAGLPGYRQYMGYKVTSLKPLLYYLAMKEPGHFYLGAVSSERGSPAVREYHHVAVFFPYFDAAGTFTIAVFESAKETPVDKFVANNASSYVNLSRVLAPERGYFEP